MKPLAIIWMRFGPYHLARLRAAGRVLAPVGYRVHGIEIAGTDSVYEWDVVAGEESDFQRHTLFPGEDYNKLLPSRITAAVNECLDHLAPGAVSINGWGVPEARAALAWCRRHRVPAILMSETFPGGASYRPNIVKELAKSWLVRRFDAALVGGEPHRQYVQKLGLPHDRIFRGYDVVDNDFFERGADQARGDAEALRKARELPTRYFFANTRFLPRKNIDGLLRSYRMYRDRMGEQSWGLVISGSGSIQTELRQLADSLGLSDVRWPGFLQYPDLPVYYGLASAFIHPAKAEPWGLVLNEAVAAGLPVLSSLKVGSAHELIRDGESGYLFDPFSDSSIADAMVRVTNLTTEDHESMGQASRRIAAEWGPNRFGSGLAKALNAATRSRSAVESR